MQYLPSIKSVVTRGTITNSILFHHDYRHDTKECHAMRKKNKTIDHQRLSSPVHEKKTEHERKECALDDLSKIK